MGIFIFHFQVLIWSLNCVCSFQTIFFGMHTIFSFKINCVRFHTTRYQRLWYNDCTVVTAAMSACILAQKRYCPSFNRLWGRFCDNHLKARQTMDFCVKNVALIHANSKQSGSVTGDVWLASKWKKYLQMEDVNRKLPPLVNAHLRYEAGHLWQRCY